MTFYYSLYQIILTVTHSQYTSPHTCETKVLCCGSPYYTAGALWSGLLLLCSVLFYSVPFYPIVSCFFI